MICPNPKCDYQGEPEKRGRGDVATGAILLLLGIIPGLIYFLFTAGFVYRCPKCGVQIAEE